MNLRVAFQREIRGWLDQFTQGDITIEPFIYEDRSEINDHVDSLVSRLIALIQLTSRVDVGDTEGGHIE